MAMGGADVVPGVSGGTIAFITGIYEELLESLSNLNFGLLKTLRKEGVKSFWKAVNGNFLITLFAGIITSLLLLAKGVEYLLHHHPILLWSFFFGLILASVWLMGKQVEKWNAQTVIALIIGTFIAYYITIVAPVGGNTSWWYIILSGAIAITAMILPGISGSFILLLLGMYATILGALNDTREALTAGAWEELTASGTIVLLFIVGCLAGLLLFSKGLNWLFKNYRNVTIALLTGFLIGSLNKIYPWKEVLESYVKHKGEPDEEVVPLVSRNVLPETFTKITGEPSHLSMALVCFVIGIILIVVLDRFSPKN